MQPPAPNVSVAEQLAAAQLEKITLEIRKLHEEVSEQSWNSWITKLTPLISVVIGVAGFLFGVYQFRAQTLKEQNAERASAAVTQKLQLQSRIREDVEQLLRFFTDEHQTIAAASFRLADLRTHLALAGAQGLEAVPVQLTDERTITASLVSAVSDDSNFMQYRDVAFVAEILSEWPDYKRHLSDDQAAAAFIVLDKYTAAVESFAKREPDVMANISIVDGHYIYDASVGILGESDQHYFRELCSGLRRHLKLLKGKDDLARVQRRLTRRLGNPELVRNLLGSAFVPEEKSMAVDSSEPSL